MTSAPLILPLIGAKDVEQVGGKAINLYHLMQAGLPVPDGFVVTTTAYREADSTGFPSASVVQQIKEAYKTLGEPTVAVRSSATAEDMAGASMAGQYDTFLDISGGDAVVEAVQKCWQSLHAERVQSYLKEHSINPDEVAVAVVVQRLVPAEVSGVLFTANPRTGAADEMVVEAVYGLGEGLVSGDVQPDVYHLCAESGNVLDLHVAEKVKALRPGNDQYQKVSAAQANKACLNHQQLQELLRLGQATLKYYGKPQDIEWALADGKIFLLQARAITTLAETKTYHALLEETRSFLKSELTEGRGPWVRHNLSETLPLPSPLTWSLIQPFMSGSGGFGRMHERVGFSPSAIAKDHGFLELIAGQIFMDCSRLPEMFSEGYPYAYDLEELRRNPDAAQQPPNVASGSYKELAAAARLGGQVTQKIRDLAQTLDNEFDEVFAPRVNAWREAQNSQVLESLSDDELITLWQIQQKTVLNEFGAEVFLPSMVEALAAADLKAFLTEHVWDKDPEYLLQQLSVSPKRDVTFQSNVELQKVAKGQRDLESWLKTYGYRGPGEFDLASPRWSERREALQVMANQLADAPDVAASHHLRKQEADQCLAELKQLLSPSLFAELDGHVALLQRYIRFREDGKAVFISAFAQLRITALEFGRRLSIGDDVFFLHTDEICLALQQGFIPQDRIAQRKLQHKVAKQYSLPHVIEEGDIPTLGEPQLSEDSDSWSAFPVASGACTGLARIVHDPTEAHDLGEDYILVCPSTDPAWTPLFVKAAGLILERGGGLSHGAIVAREMGLPAVVLENATTLFTEGETLTINGNQGQVARSHCAPDSDADMIDPDDTHIGFEQRLPLAGQKECTSNQRGFLVALFWGVLVGIMFILPAGWLKDPVFGLIDMILWPFVRSVGMVWTVAIVGAIFAILPLVIQRFVSDNARLLEAKKRSFSLRKAASHLPQGSPRRKALARCAAPSTTRNLKASMAALAWVVGPMMLVFFWMPERLDPASWNADPGGMVTIVAELDGEYQKPVSCTFVAPLLLEETTPTTQTLPPIRATLEDLRREWQQSGDLSTYPWQLQTAGEQAQEILIGSLNAYLANGVPPQKLTWMIRVPADASGHYPVTLQLHDGTKQELMLAFGDKEPPTQSMIEGDSEPLVQTEIVYPRSLKQRHFWTPLKIIGGSGWDFGWLGVYIFSYLQFLLVLKKILRVA